MVGAGDEELVGPAIERRGSRHRHGAGRGRGAEGARRDDLVDVAVRDMVLQPGDERLIGGVVEIDLGSKSGGPGGGGAKAKSRRPGAAVDQIGEPLLRAEIGARRRRPDRRTRRRCRRRGAGRRARRRSAIRRARRRNPGKSSGSSAVAGSVSNRSTWSKAITPSAQSAKGSPSAAFSARPVSARTRVEGRGRGEALGGIDAGRAPGSAAAAGPAPARPRVRASRSRDGGEDVAAAFGQARSAPPHAPGIRPAPRPGRSAGSGPSSARTASCPAAGHRRSAPHRGRARPRRPGRTRNRASASPAPGGCVLMPACVPPPAPPDRAPSSGRRTGPGRATARRPRAPPPDRRCTSTRMPSAPQAAAASAIGMTRSRMPVPCEGSTRTGRCVFCLM